MATEIEIKIDTSNFQILEGAFKRLAVKDQKKVLQTAFKKATLPLVAMIKNNVLMSATDRGNLFRSIGTISSKNEAGLWVGSVLKTKYLTKNGKISNVWYGRLTEGGAHNVGRRVKGVNRKVAKSLGMGGNIPASHWFSGAWEWGKYEAYENVEKEFQKSLDDFLKKETSNMK